MEASLSLDIAATRDELERHHRWLQDRLKPRRASYRVLTGSAPIVDAVSGLLLIDLGGPPAGLLWALQWIAVFPDPTATSTGGTTAVLCVGIPTQRGVLNVGDVVIPQIVVPGQSNLPDSVLARGGQHAYAVLSGALSTDTIANFFCNVGALVGDDAPETTAWI